MSKVSEALENLAYIKEQLPFYDSMGFELIIDESDFETIEKALKALKIIRKKRVNFYRLFDCFREGGLEKYNGYLDMLYLPECHLSEEQFDLLKEVLLCD